MNVQGCLPPPKGSGRAKITRTRHQGPVTRLRHMRLALEVALARVAGRLSRLAGRGGGTTFPGKLLATIDPGAVSTLARAAAARLARSSRPRTARRRRRRWSPRSSRRASGSRTTARARTSSPGSPRRCSPPRTPSSGCSRSTRARFPEVARARPAARRLPRQPLPRPARPLRRARARRRALARCRSRAARTLGSSSTATTRRSASSRAAAAGAVSSGSTTRAHARPSLQHAADSKYCLRCGTPYEYAAAYVGPPRRLPLPELRPRAAAARRRRARDRAATGSTAASFTLATPEGDAARRARAARPLQRLQRARPRRRSRWRSAPRLDEIAAGLGRFTRRVRPLRADRDRRPAAC